jgi:hypothetical protein
LHAGEGKTFLATVLDAALRRIRFRAHEISVQIERRVRILETANLFRLTGTDGAFSSANTFGACCKK